MDDLGWSDHFAAQITPEHAHLTPARLTTVARSRLRALSTDGLISLQPPPDTRSGTYATGDWVLFDPATGVVVHTLERTTLLTRPSAATATETQLIAANIDTLGIVTSCNADFNPARLERYLALAAAAGTRPLIILTKADQAEDTDPYVQAASALSPDVTVIALNAKDPAAPDLLAPWCSDGQTLALVGSSGVGKSTLSNALTGGAAKTQDIRDDDAKGRHTTSARGLAATLSGGWLIDTPGMRALPLGDVGDGIAAVFADLAELSTQCKFSDCAHTVEPGCAVQAAVAKGDVLADRVARWLKLTQEDARNTATRADNRQQAKSRERTYKKAQKAKKKRK